MVRLMIGIFSHTGVHLYNIDTYDDITSMSAADIRLLTREKFHPFISEFHSQAAKKCKIAFIRDEFRGRQWYEDGEGKVHMMDDGMYMPCWKLQNYKIVADDG